MAEQSFQSTTDNSETRMANFFQSVCTNSVSINLIESELSNEICKRRKLGNDRRELKCKIKELVEKLKATEILMDISNAAIQVLEKAMEGSGNGVAPLESKDGATKSQESFEKTSTPDTNVTQKAPIVTQDNSMPLSSSSFSTFAFSDIASNTCFEELTKFLASRKTVFAGGGTPLFQNLNTSAEEGAATESREPIEKTSTQVTNVTQQAPLVTQESSMPFSSSFVEKSD